MLNGLHNTQQFIVVTHVSPESIDLKHNLKIMRLACYLIIYLYFLYFLYKQLGYIDEGPRSSVA